MGMKRVMFEEASAQADWRFPYQIIAPGMDWDEEVDEVVLGMTPDYASWDDYGFRQRSFPMATADNWAAPFYQASSDDSSGVVTLIDPNLIDIAVPYTVMRQLGPGGCNVGVSYRNKLTGQRSTLISGRLPIYDGVI
jgi:hypothetical protein